MKVVPATSELWPKLEQLFGPKGAYSGCWCMFWRLERAEFKKKKGPGTKAELKKHTSQGRVPGVIGFVDGQAAGWCSIGPRQDYLALENSRILKRIDAAPVWSIVCFFVAKEFRRQSAMNALLVGAIAYAKNHGASIIEGYPLDLDGPKLKDQTLSSFAGYMGIASAFKQAGFKKVGQASETQLIMRLML